MRLLQLRTLGDLAGPAQNLLLRLDPRLAEELSAVAAVEGRARTSVVDPGGSMIDWSKRDRVLQPVLAKA